MKEHPIIFSTPMVQAILEGRKTQTRRVVKLQFDTMWSKIKHPFDVEIFYGSMDDWADEIKCPYGQVGDKLWVRETWRPSQIEDEPWFKAGVWDYGKTRLMTIHESHLGLNGTNKWKPSIHMPKKYARIWLEITEVRVERLQDITYKDVEKEGVDFMGKLPHPISWHPQTHNGADQMLNFVSRHEFQKLWDSINGKKHPWSSNPWVWVVEFKKC